MSIEHRIGTAQQLRSGDYLPADTADALEAFYLPQLARIDVNGAVEVTAIVTAPDYAEITLCDGRTFTVPTHWRFPSLRLVGGAR